MCPEGRRSRFADDCNPVLREGHRASQPARDDRRSRDSRATVDLRRRSRAGAVSGLPTPPLADVLAALPITLALARTFPNAKRLASDGVDAAGMWTYLALLLRRLGTP